LKILRGNGGIDGDGLVVDSVNAMLKDGNPLTIIAYSSSLPPPKYPEARSAYGSVLLSGTFTTLKMELYRNPDTIMGDGGTFQISLPSAVPEPTTIALIVFGIAGLGFSMRKREVPFVKSSP